MQQLVSAFRTQIHPFIPVNGFSCWSDGGRLAAEPAVMNISFFIVLCSCFCSMVLQDVVTEEANDRWTVDKVQTLLSINATEDIQRELETATRDKKG